MANAVSCLSVWVEFFCQTVSELAGTVDAFSNLCVYPKQDGLIRWSVRRWPAAASEAVSFQFLVLGAAATPLPHPILGIREQQCIGVRLCIRQTQKLSLT